MVFAELRGSGTVLQSQTGRMEFANSVGKRRGGRKVMEVRERSGEMGNSHVPRALPSWLILRPHMALHWAMDHQICGAVYVKNWRLEAKNVRMMKEH